MKNIYISSKGRIINYLLNHRVNDGTAVILKGDQYLTKKIIRHIKFKDKLYAGVLSFEEKNIDERLKTNIMRSFEEILLPNMEGRYNILWVEHTDKGRLELNYVIPKIDLLTNRVLNPFWYKTDKKRIELWTDKINIQHNLSDPKDPSKKQILNNDKRDLLLKDYKELNEVLLSVVSKGIINNRNKLIDYLKKSNIEVEKINKNSLKLKLPESKNGRTLKGGIYSEKFRSLRDIKQLYRRERKELEEYINRDTQAELDRIEQQISIYTQRKNEYIQKRYIEAGRVAEGRMQRKYEEYDEKRNIRSFKNGEKRQYKNNNNFNSIFDINDYNSNSSSFHSKSLTDGKHDLLLLGIRKENDDNYRTILQRNRRRRELKRGTLFTIREERKLFYERTFKYNKDLQSESVAHENQIRREYEESHERERKTHFRDKKRLSGVNIIFNDRITEAYERRRSYSRQGEIILGAIEDIAATVEKNRRRIKEYKQSIEYIKNFISEKKELIDNIEYSFDDSENEILNRGPF